MRQRTQEELEAGLAGIRESPAVEGTVELIVRRPGVDAREVLEEGRLTELDGLVGDHWRARGSHSSPDGGADPECQLTLMNARLIDLLAEGDREAWPLAGDQLYVDLDLSVANLPAGTRLAVGTAVVEVTAPPHTGCAKFSARFGSEALRLANSPEGRALRLRGLHVRVIEPGVVRAGDTIRKA
jgi:MOSC domain-containing protein YiiM